MIDENMTILKTAYISEEKYKEAVDEALGEYLEGFQRKSLDSHLVVYERRDSYIFRMVFFDMSKLAILLVYTFDSKEVWEDGLNDDQALLYLNYSLLFPKFGKDLEGQTDIKYAFSIQNSLSMTDLKLYMDHMDQTLQRVND